MTNYLTDQDVQNYGTELIDVAQRAAAQVMSPQLQQIQHDHAMLQQRLAIESRRNMDAAVERAIPNYRELDQNPQWHTWLLGIDELSGRQRQSLLNEATASGDASRAIAFFRSFFSGPRQGAGQSMQHTAARRQPSHQGAKIYSRAEIAQIYEARRKGAYQGEGVWDRLEQEIIRAAAEGRITGGEPLGVK